MVVQPLRVTTEGHRSQGGASRSLGGRDDNRSFSSAKGRWIPPSSLRRDALSQEDQYDITFRKIRGILNKLTPENFDKLSNDLLNVGLNSRAILGGLILLIFQKALDESKYCSMYAQLCKRLSEDAPNFDPPNCPCTFNRLLLQQCQEEFERRRNTKDVWSACEEGSLSPEEEEQRQAARRKMVGNLRFIGELGKLQIVQKSILYNCIEELLLDKGNRSTRDLAEDLECLCQIMRTSGRMLDTPEAKSLMEQFFARIRRLSQSPKLNMRIRFMLQDTIDLRDAGWYPRTVAQQEGPRTIVEVREQAARDLGIYIPPLSCATTAGQPYGATGGLVSPLSSNLPTFFPQTPSNRTGMEDVFGLPLGGAVSLGTGPGVIPSHPDKFSPFDSNNGFGGHRDGLPRGDGPFSGRGGRHVGGNMSPNYSSNKSYYQNKHFTNSYNRQQQGGNQAPPAQHSYSNSASKDLPPRFKKHMSGGGGVSVGDRNSALSGQTGGASGGTGGSATGGGGIMLGLDRDISELSLRPSAPPMSLKPKIPGLLPQSALSSNTGSSESKAEQRSTAPYPSVQPPNLKPPTLLPGLHKDPPLVIRQIPADKTSKNKKDKGPPREDYMRRVRAVVKDLANDVKSASISEEADSTATVNGERKVAAIEERVAAACQAYADIKLPELLAADAAHALLAAILKLDEGGRELGGQLLIKLRTDKLLTHDKLWDGLKQALSEVEASVSDFPRGKGQLAEVLAQLIMNSTLTLSELAELTQAGAYFPLYLLILQHLHKLLGKQHLTRIFNDSKVNLLHLVPESERTKEQLSDLLEDRQLSFLYPLLRIQSELSAALIKDSAPNAFFKYIKDTLDENHHTAPEFINALVTVLLKYITQQTTLAKGIDPSIMPDKTVSEKEKDCLSRFNQVLQAFLHDHIDLQVTAIYALQVFTYTNNFPKGMLLRWFVYLYDLEIIEEDAFLAWKEEVNDNYPGKGKALFQVNQWLTWLQETEEDDEDEEEA